MKPINFLKKYIAFALLIPMVLAACKKNKSQPEGESNNGQTTTSNRTELTNDSLFLYAKQIYYWNESLPSYDVFRPRQYNTASTDLANYENNLFNIVKSSGSPDYIPNSPYPKYSYIDNVTDNNSTQAFVPISKSTVELDGIGYDLGFLTFKAYGTDDSYELYVAGVFPGSPADSAGLTRGAVITKINGTTIGTDFSAEQNLINSLLEGILPVKLSGFKKDGTPFDNLNLKIEKYTSSPIYSNKTFTGGSKMIGYLALAHFSDLETNAKTDLDLAFTKFATDGVTDLIIDLRYNGGGYVGTAEYLIDLIAPSTLTGTMFKEYYNKDLQNGKATIMTHQPLPDQNNHVQYENGKMVTYNDIDYSPEKNITLFNKKGTLNGVSNIVFIVSGNTASASELVINSLKPHMTVKMVGTQTYGKPVGFFPIRLEEKYDVYLALFETKNSNDEGGYFTGFKPDVLDIGTNAVFDDATHDFGDPQENYTKNAINLLVPGVPVTTANAMMSIQGKRVSVASSLSLTKKIVRKDGFIGMVETRHQIKK